MLPLVIKSSTGKEVLSLNKQKRGNQTNTHSKKKLHCALWLSLGPLVHLTLARCSTAELHNARIARSFKFRYFPLKPASSARLLLARSQHVKHFIKAYYFWTNTNSPKQFITPQSLAYIHASLAVFFFCRCLFHKPHIKNGFRVSAVRFWWNWPSCVTSALVAFCDLVA